MQEQLETIRSLLRPKDLVKQLGITPPTLIRWLKDGRILGAQKVGGVWLIAPDYEIIPLDKQAKILARTKKAG